MQDMNQSASKIESFFNHYRTMFTNNLSAILDLMTLKENEYKSIKCLFVNTSFFKSLSKQQSWNEWQSDKNHQSTARDYWEVYSLSKIIKLSKRLLKSELL